MKIYAPSTVYRFFGEPGAVCLLIASLAMAGCASSGAPRLSDAALSGNPEAMWTEGQELVKRGEKLISDGEKDMEKARKQVRDGEEKIDSGNIAVLRSRQDYQNAALDSGQSSTPDEVIDESKRLKNIGADWDDAIEKIRDGNKLVSKGGKNIEDAQETIREGRVLIETGSALMRNSQRIRMGEPLLPYPR